MIVRATADHNNDDPSRSIFKVLLTPAGITATTVCAVTLILIFCLLCIPDMRHKCCCTCSRRKRKQPFTSQDYGLGPTYELEPRTWRNDSGPSNDSSLNLLPANTAYTKMRSRDTSQDRWHAALERGRAPAGTVSEQAADGSWRHTMYANVPMPERPPSARTISREHERVRTPRGKKTWRR